MAKTSDKSKIEVIDYEVGAEGYRNVATYDEKRYVGASNEYKQGVMSDAYWPLLGAIDGKRVLDVGCGTGRGLREFVPRAKFTAGCDASIDMLRAAAQKLTAGNNWGLASAHAQRLPFADDTFDLVSSFNFLHLFTLETQQEMISEMKRVTRPEGTLMLEFDNALHGLVVLGLFKRWFRQERGTLPWEAQRIIGNDCRVVKIRTAPLPVVWRVLYRLPKPLHLVEKLGYIPVLNRVLGHRIYYQIKKCSPT